MIITNTTKLPKVFERLAEKVLNNHPDMKGNEFSVTELLKGTKEIILNRRHKDEIVVDVQELFNLLMGVAMHKMLEEEAKEIGEMQDLSEERFYTNLGEWDKELEGYTLSGSPDYYVGEDKALWDYKTSKVAQYDKNTTLKDKEWLKQLEAYTLMLRAKGYEVKHARNVAMLKDHSFIRAGINGHPDYPINIIDYSNFINEEEVFEILKSEYVAKAKEVIKAMQLEDDDIPPCTAEERWAESDWAIMKKGKERAVRANLSSKEEAEQVLEGVKDKTDCYIQYREGKSTKCEKYCQCKHFCNFWKEHFGGINEQTH